MPFGQGADANSMRTNSVSLEQAYVDMLYGLLDTARERAREALTVTHATGTSGGTFQARVEREVTAGEQARRLAQLEGVEYGLCFGRTDASPGEAGLGEVSAEEGSMGEVSAEEGASAEVASGTL